jgi:hypothetical protein
MCGEVPVTDAMVRIENGVYIAGERYRIRRTNSTTVVSKARKGGVRSSSSAHLHKILFSFGQ